MTVRILFDNQAAANESLQHEHGLSIYFEADGKRILLDTGLTSVLPVLFIIASGVYVTLRRE